MPNKLEIVLLQLNVDYGSPQSNYQSVDKLLFTFQPKSDVDHSIILLPELFTTGYDLKAIAKYAEPIKDSTTIRYLQVLAIKKQSWIVTSYPELFKSQTFNTGLIINPNGKLVYSYQKIHLFSPLGEKKAFNRGNKLGLMKNSPWGPTGLLICYDLRFPEQFIPLRDEKTVLFLLVAEWPIKRIDHWLILAQARAIENQAYFIGVNRVGTDVTATYGGNSVVISPTGEILGKMNSDEGLLSINITLDNISEVRKTFNIMNDAKVEINK